MYQTHGQSIQAIAETTDITGPQLCVVASVRVVTSLVAGYVRSYRQLSHLTVLNS